MSTALPVPTVQAPAEARLARRETLGQLARSKTFLVGVLVVGFWVFWAIVGGRLTPHDPLEQFPDVLVKPSHTYWLGTDNLGRDVLSRVLAGATGVLEIAPLAMLLGVAGGTVVGLVTGYFRGLVDEAISRVIDAVLALPLVIVALLALAAVGASNLTVILVIGITFTPITARTVRAAVFAERHLDYVAAAQLRGENALYIMFIEILPNVMPPILVEATVRLGYAIFTVATLSFLGFCIQAPSPDWGLAISESYGMIKSGAWWTVLFDALAIASLVVAVNLVADAIHGVFET